MRGMKKCPHCGKVLLSDRGERVLNFIKIKNRGVTSTEVIRELNMSICNANNYLRELWVIGLLERKQCRMGNMGNGFEYSLTKKGVAKW